jgi:RNA polymerase sigma-70 factor, ECF subfamily
MTAFEEIVEGSTPSIYRLARAFVGDAGAPDVVQEVFLAAWRELPRLRDPDRFGPWLHRIAVNRCRTVLRTKVHVREIAVSDATMEGAAVATDLRPAVESRESIGVAFATLSDDHRSVIVLHYAAGLSIREVAESLGIPEGTAKSRLNAALVVMRRSIREDDR